MPYYFSHPLSDLKTIPVSLMAKLVSHPDLFVIQTEYSIYVMLKYWIYLLIFPDSDEPSIVSVNEYFCSRTGKKIFTIMIKIQCRYQDVKML